MLVDYPVIITCNTVLQYFLIDLSLFLGVEINTLNTYRYGLFKRCF